jgi:hypothetical protein
MIGNCDQETWYKALELHHCEVTIGFNPTLAASLAASLASLAAAAASALSAPSVWSPRVESFWKTSSQPLPSENR